MSPKETIEILYLNARSLVKKIDELSATVVEINPDIILVTETWCNDRVSTPYLNINGYRIELRLDRSDTSNGIGGGIIVYIKSDLTILPNDQTEVKFDQSLSCRIQQQNKDSPTDIYVIYRSPNSNESNDMELCRLVSNLESDSVLIGDFNYPRINWTNMTADKKSKLFLDTVQDKLLYQYVDFSTHIAGNTLDLVLSNNSDLVVGVEEYDVLGKSDHKMIGVTLKLGVEKTCNLQKIPDWRNADSVKLCHMADCVDWESEMVNKGANQSWIYFKEKLFEIQNKCVPVKIRRPNNRPIWLDRQTQSIIRKKYQLYKRFKQSGREIDRTKYDEQNKLAKNAVRKAKRKFERKLAQESRGNNNKKFNSYIKSRVKSRTTIGPLKDEFGDLTDENDKMAEILNLCFSNAFTAENISQPEQLPKLKENISFNEVRFHRRDIEKKINKLKPSSSPGCDEISAHLLKILIKTVSLPLQLIYTKSFETGVVPDDWKSGNVMPIFKKGTKSNPSNYRPVSLTSIPCKIMEGLIRDQCMDFLLAHDLMNSSQHGFMKNKSCATNLLEFLESVTSNLDNNVPLDLIFLDFSKAFDKVPRVRLLNKMAAHGIDGKVHRWISNWLGGRIQRVVLNGSHSTWRSVLSGVPQGSVLGPILFVIFINDIDDVVSSVSTIKKFADDTKLGQALLTQDDSLNLQECLDKLTEWSNKWGMSFNVEKCKVMHVGHNNPGYTYKMNNVELASVDQEKDIGVIMHKSLKPSKQCSEAARKAAGILRQISKSFHYRDRKTFLKLYTTYVRPHLEFSTPSWNPWLVTDVEVLECVQKRAIGMISGLKGPTYEEKLDELGIMSLLDRRLRADMIQTYKILNSVDKVEKEIWFQEVHNREGAVTRLAADPMNLVSKQSRTEIRKNFFSCRVVPEWNNLPSDVKSASSVMMFKSLYDCHWRSLRSKK